MKGIANMRFGPPEILIVLVIVLLLFGPGRISKIAGELGKSISSFRDGLKGEKEEKEDKETPEEDSKKPK